jgi:hypothetical protein
MGQQHFDTPGEVEIRVENKAGPVRLRTHTTPTTEVEVMATGPMGQEAVAHTLVEHTDLGGRHRISIEVPHRGGLVRSLFRSGTDVLVTVQLPEGAAIDVTAAAGPVTAEGRFGDSSIATASGTMSVGAVDGGFEARSASGNVTVGSVAGKTDIATASGSVRCGRLLGPGHLKTASGDIAVEVARGRLTVRTASGDFTAGELADGGQFETVSGDSDIGRLVAGRSSIKSVSGNVTVGVARGTAVIVDAETFTGNLSSEIELGEDEPAGDDGPAHDGPRAELRARTVSGDLRIERAPS